MTPLEQHISLMSSFARFDAEQSDLAPLMVASAPPGQRAFVYRNSGMLALVEALRSNYARLNALMGETFFSEMAKAYIHKHPAKKRSLIGYGEKLADFIDLQVEEHKLPWLGDLARLDRAWLEAHLSADAAPLTAEQMAAIPHDKLLEGLIAFHPSLKIVETRSDMAPLWLNLKAGILPNSEQSLEDIPSAMMFWRPGGEVLAKSLTPEDYAFLEILLHRKTLNEACSRLMDTYPDADLPSLIAGVFSADLITDIINSEAL